MPSPPTGSSGGTASPAMRRRAASSASLSEVVVLLPGRVRADDGEASARAAAAVARARGQDEHVAGGDVERLALRPAELDRRAAAHHREHLVGVRVEVVEVEHAVDPRAAASRAPRGPSGRRPARRRGRSAPGTADGSG